MSPTRGNTSASRWWLPSDPRGSTSSTIRQDHLEDLGRLHFGRKRAQPSPREVRAVYAQAAARLARPLLSLSPQAFATVARCLGDAIGHCNYTCYAAAVMPDHVHLVLRKHRGAAETMIDRLQ